MRFIEWLTENGEWDEQPPDSETRSKKIQGVDHQVSLLYNTILKITDPFRASRLIGTESIQAKETPKPGELRTQMELYGDPVILVTQLSLLSKGDAKLVLKLSDKLEVLYNEQAKY